MKGSIAMALFTPSDREAIKNDLVSLLTASQDISAVVLVGSATRHSNLRDYAQLMKML